MAKTMCTVLGIAFILVGIVGFLAPTFLGAHLTLAHNLIHVISGAIALYLGLAGSLAAARTFCIVFGAVYLLLGLVGFLAGEGPERMFTVIPGQLMLGTMDHLIHIVLGTLFLVGAFATRAVAATRH
jgi:hypothetical protein